MRVYESGSERDTERIASALAEELRPGDVIAFRGGLGAGKTAFTRGLAAGLGINADDVCSPTFALVHEYRGGRVPLCHFDMYRVNGGDALYSTGFFDYLDSDAILAIEWSENMEKDLPENAIVVTIATGDTETARRIVVEGGGRF